MEKSIKNKSGMGRALFVVALGIVYGDIATSPMYVMKSIVEGNGGLSQVTEEYVLGALSLIIWTLTLITTVKYVLIAMKADNNGEGGIFALYSLVRRYGKWLIVPALIGGAALLADGVLTPAVTVTNAVEGLRILPQMDALFGDNQAEIMVIVIVILVIIFAMQRAGTSVIGKAFGPIMIIWFLFLSVAGISCFAQCPSVIRAINPMYAINILFSAHNHMGLMILGSVFLATTGAEALYSDMGHVGKRSIYVSWPIVKISLILNYFGQSAWMLMNLNNSAALSAEKLNPFYSMLMPGLDVIGVILGAVAAIIASQALISGSFSIVSEAIRLELLPPLHTFYPGKNKGQLYIPMVNNILMCGCILVVLIFQTSSHMESAYGLAITITLLATTVLLATYLYWVKKKPLFAFLYLIIFGFIEGVFFISCLGKFTHGGYFAIIIACLIGTVMVLWYCSGVIEKSQRSFVPLNKYINRLERLRNDSEVPYCCDNLVYLSTARSQKYVELDIMYSIFDNDPKRAKTYWFVNINVTSKPHTRKYKVETFGTDFIYRVTLNLGFQEDQKIGIYIKQIAADLLRNGEFAPQHRKYTSFSPASIKKLRPGKLAEVGHFKYCYIHKSVSSASDLKDYQVAFLTARQLIRRVVDSQAASWYGLEYSSAIIEFIPFFIPDKQYKRLSRSQQKSNQTTGPIPKV